MFRHPAILSSGCQGPGTPSEIKDGVLSISNNKVVSKKVSRAAFTKLFSCKKVLN